MMRPSLLVIAVFLCGSVLHAADDWPHLRGPDMVSGIAPADWLGSSAPSIAWQQHIGLGYSGIVHQGGKLICSGCTDEENAVLRCLSLADGSTIWSTAYPSKVKPFERFKYVGGPNATPTIGDGKVFVATQDVFLRVYDFADGKELYSIDFKEHGYKRQNFGFSSTPIVLGDKLYLNLAKFGICLSTKDGSVIWKTADEKSSYASPLVSNRSGRQLLYMFGRDGLAAMDPSDGQQVWFQDWYTSKGGNIAYPVFTDYGIFVSSAYGVGSGMVAVNEGKPSLTWKQPEIRQHQTPPVFIDGHIYGMDAHISKPGDLYCLDAANGKILWREPGYGMGTMAAAGKEVVAFSETGELVLFTADAKGFKARHRLQVVDDQIWQSPSLFKGGILVRSSKGHLFRINVN